MEEIKKYSKEELLHLNAQSILTTGKRFQYRVKEYFGIVETKDYFSINSDLLEKAFSEVIPEPEVAKLCTQLVKKLMCEDLGSDWNLSIQEYYNRNLGLAIADEEIENLLKSTPISIKWHSPSTWAEEVLLCINGELYCVVSFYNDIYPQYPAKGPVRPNLHSINKDNF